jgi:histone H3
MARTKHQAVHSKLSETKKAELVKSGVNPKKLVTGNETNKAKRRRLGRRGLQRKYVSDHLRLTRSVLPMCRKQPFVRLVREVAQDLGADVRFQAKALEALQEGTEYFMTELLANAESLVRYSKRDTLMYPDLLMAIQLCAPPAIAMGVVDKHRAAREALESQLKAVTQVKVKAKKKKQTKTTESVVEPEAVPVSAPMPVPVPESQPTTV